MNYVKGRIFEILLSVSLLTDNFKPFLILREFGTKPFVLVLLVGLFLNVKTYSTSFIRLGLFILLFFILILIRDVYRIDFEYLKQYLLIFTICSIVYAYSIANYSIDFYRVLQLAVILHIIILIFEYLFAFLPFRSELNFVEYEGGKLHGYFSEPSWSSFFISIAPFLFQKNKYFFVFTYIFALVNYITVDSGTGIAVLVIGTLILILRQINFNLSAILKIKTFFILSIIVLIGYLIFPFLANRFSTEYNESNATRILIPLTFIDINYFHKFFWGVGIGKMGLILKNDYSTALINLSEFNDFLNDNSKGRFNSFNLYLRTIYEFGLFYIFILLFFMNRFFKCKIRPIVNYASRYNFLFIPLIISTMSNDSYNNPYLIMFLIMIGKEYVKRKLQTNSIFSYAN